MRNMMKTLILLPAYLTFGWWYLADIFDCTKAAITQNAVSNTDSCSITSQ